MGLGPRGFKKRHPGHKGHKRHKFEDPEPTTLNPTMEREMETLRDQIEHKLIDLMFFFPFPFSLFLFP